VTASIMKRVEILYFESCPGWQPTLQRIREVVAREGLDAVVAIKTIAIETDEQAQHARFIGSPTVRVDGRDIDPTSIDNTNFGLQCRVYQNEGRLDRLPPEDLIRSALGVGGSSCP
jgi:hypothetical protein